MNKRKKTLLLTLVGCLCYFLINRRDNRTHIIINEAAHKPEAKFNSSNDVEKSVSTNKVLKDTPLDLMAAHENRSRSIVQQERLATLHKACVEYKTEMDNFKWRRLIYVGKDIKFAYCSIEKVGSRTWSTRMAKLGIKTQYGTKRGDSLSPKVDNLKGYTVAMTVRHPFERLVSAYRDKILYNSWRQWPMKVVKDFDAVPNDQRERPGRATFSEFVDFHLNGGTFNEASQDFDMHVRPFFHDCDPCGINYTAIIKMSTMEEDTKYVMDSIGVEDPLKGEKSHINQSKGQASSDTLTRNYMAQLSHHQVERLIEIYKFDLEAFGYAYEEFMI